MPNTSLTLRILELKPQELAKLSPEEIQVFFICGHILNELNSLNKVFCWCIHPDSNPASETNGIARGMQAMIYARILAGKLYEARKVLAATWFRRKPPSYLPALHPEAMTALAAIKIYFNDKNSINQVRNHAAFHYSAAALSENWESLAHENSLKMIFGGTIKNNFFHASEMLANAALLKIVNTTDLEAGMAKFMDDVQTVAADFTTFLEGATVSFLQLIFGSNFGDKTTEEKIDVQQSFLDVRIPYFCAEDNKT